MPIIGSSKKQSKNNLHSKTWRVSERKADGLWFRIFVSFSVQNLVKCILQFCKRKYYFIIFFLASLFALYLEKKTTCNVYVEIEVGGGDKKFGSFFPHQEENVFFFF